MSRKKAPPSVREIRQRHEEGIAALVRQREALEAEIAILAAKRQTLEQECVCALVDLLALYRLLDESHDDAEWLRRKAVIRQKTRSFLDRKLAPRPEDLGRQGLSASVAKRLHAYLDDIQADNEYAHATGDFASKTELQNHLIERYAPHLDIRWDGPRELLIEFKGRSAGHLPVTELSAGARKAIAPFLHLKPHRE